MHSTYYLLALLVAALVQIEKVSATPTPPLPNTSPCKIAGEMLSIASSVRALKPKSEVLCVVSTRDDIKKFLVDTIKTKLPPEKVRMEEVLYKALGVIPEAFDYEQGIISLYVSQIGGYYDPEKKHFVMADWIPNGLQEEVLIHELTHALQDQHYNLEPFLDSKMESGDMLLARSALVEGDAMIVMSEYERQQRKERSLREDLDVDALVQRQLEAATVGSTFPESLQAILLFPYTDGVRFAHALLRSKEGFAGIDSAYQDPPQSTREILHPEVYRNPSAPKLEIPTLEELKTYLPSAKAIYSDTLGELIIRALLCEGRADKGTCQVAAKGWLGDRAAIFERVGGDREIVWLTRWESTADAGEFLAAYGHGVRERHGLEINTDGAIRISANKLMKIQQIGATVVVRVSSSNNPASRYALE